MSAAEIGLIGLGVMGSNLAMNIAEKGFRIAVWNRKTERTEAFMENAGDLAGNITPTKTYEDLVAAIKPPRAIILMVPAGDVIDQVIATLSPLLDADDLIVDAGNANFHNSIRRSKEAEDAPHAFLGMGVSGGAEGARHGPSIMGGGRKADWDRVSHILEAISAKYEGQPCATWMGEDGAGHFVKTVHNGIEYADMQLIAETYGVMRDGMAMTASAIGNVFQTWNDGPLQSYLIEISAKVANTKDAESDKPILDVILDRAGQKGTGRWTVIESQQVGAPVPVIEAAVAARNMSADLATRKTGEDVFGASPLPLPADALSIDELEAALMAGKIMCYAQGFALLDKAGETYDWSLPMPEIAEVWREGCIIRSSMLNDMASALRDAPNRNLMFAPYFAEKMHTTNAALRKTVAVAVTHGLAVPAMSAALSYFDTMRTTRGTANMIQGQRDYFGQHSFERLDRDGEGYHGPWVS